MARRQAAAVNLLAAGGPHPCGAAAAPRARRPRAAPPAAASPARPPPLAAVSAGSARLQEGQRAQDGGQPCFDRRRGQLQQRRSPKPCHSRPAPASQPRQPATPPVPAHPPISPMSGREPAPKSTRTMRRPRSLLDSSSSWRASTRSRLRAQAGRGRAGRGREGAFQGDGGPSYVRCVSEAWGGVGRLGHPPQARQAGAPANTQRWRWRRAQRTCPRCGPRSPTGW